MKVYDVVGYTTGDGEFYCTGCFTGDSQAESVNPVYAGDEWDEYPTCDECGEACEDVVLAASGSDLGEDIVPYDAPEPTKCWNCQAQLRPGDDTLCQDCEAKRAACNFSDDMEELTPRQLSALDPGGVYNSDGECIGRLRTCSCEDYPCCGH